MSAHAPEVDAVHVKPARAALASDVIGVQPKIDFDFRTLSESLIFSARAPFNPIHLGCGYKLSA